MMIRYWMITLMVLAMTGCQKANVSIEEAIGPEAALTDSARAELHLPLKTDLTLATPADTEFVNSLTTDTVKAVEIFLKPVERTIRIAAARPIGNYLLLWVAFPEVADGGVDLIFSIEKKRVVGTFLGGYRG
jgi:hypothetical protein